MREFLIIAGWFVIGIILGMILNGEFYRNQAVQRGYAEYNQTNGNWQWKGNP